MRWASALAWRWQRGGDATLVSTEAHSTATAIGIGEAGGPTVAGQHGSILNTGHIDVNADADVTGTAIAANLRGYSMGATSITALADGYGIQGGAGATVIDNRNLIASPAMPRRRAWRCR